MPEENTSSRMGDQIRFDRESDFKILIATDNHLGYAENHPQRGQDSFVTFDEIVGLACKEKVDFLLLGGDLFHENKPSKRCMNECMRILARHCRGSAPIYMKFISDPSENFKGAHDPIPNWENPNINISLPVFSIHGNHDDPTGIGSFCPLDELSTAGLVNYFGRLSDINKELVLSPVLLRKEITGKVTTIALYGVSAMKDERLFKLLYDRKVRIVRHYEETFNILVLHQNRLKHAEARYIPETFLNFRDAGDVPFFNLVLWGHEHECKQNVERAAGNSYFILQPGSSVATSLCPGEAVEKRVFVLTVSGKKFNCRGEKLMTVRPMIYRTVRLADVLTPEDLRSETASIIQDKIHQVVLEAVNESEALLTGNPKQPKKPLIRINLEYEDEEHTFNAVRFGLQFSNLIANPEDVIKFKRVRSRAGYGDDELDGVLKDKGRSGLLEAREEFLDRGPESIEAVVKNFFQNEATENDLLQHLSPELLSAAVTEYVNKRDDNAIGHYVDLELKKAMEFLDTLELDDDVDEDKLVERIDFFRAKRGEEVSQEVLRYERNGILASAKMQSRTVHSVPSDSDVADDEAVDEDDGGAVSATFLAPGRGRSKRGSAASSLRARGRGRGRGGNQSSKIAASSDGEEVIDDAATSSNAAARGGRRGRPRAAGSNSPRGRGHQTTLDAAFKRATRR